MQVTFRIGDWKEATYDETEMTIPPRKGDYVRIDDKLREVIEVRWEFDRGSLYIDIILSENAIDESY
jgi:hypothetical protein